MEGEICASSTTGGFLFKLKKKSYMVGNLLEARKKKF